MNSDPGWNWDRLAYYALALSIDGRNPTEAHAEAYAVAKATASPSDYARLVGAGEPQGGYRRVVAEDEEAFTQQLGFYRPRVGYTYGLAALHRAGVPLHLGGLFLSLAPCLAILAFGASRLRRRHIGWVVLLTALVVLANIVGVHGPDAMATCLSVIGACLLFDDSPAVGGALLVAAIPFRTDCALFALIACLAATSRRTWMWTLATVVSTVVVAFAALRIGPGYSFGVQAHHAFVGRLNYPADAGVVWSMSDHVAAVTRNLAKFAKANSHIVLLLVALFARHRHVDRRAVVGLSAFVLVRYLVFPITEPRQYAVAAVLAVLVLAHRTSAPGTGGRVDGGPEQDPRNLIDEGTPPERLVPVP